MHLAEKLQFYVELTPTFKLCSVRSVNTFDSAIRVLSPSSYHASVVSIHMLYFSNLVSRYIVMSMPLSCYSMLHSTSVFLTVQCQICHMLSVTRILPCHCCFNSYDYFWNLVSWYIVVSMLLSCYLYLKADYGMPLILGKNYFVTKYENSAE